MSDNDAEELLPVASFDKVIKTTITQAASSSGRTERIGLLLFVATQTAQTLATEQLQPLGLSARGRGSSARLPSPGR